MTRCGLIFAPAQKLVQSWNCSECKHVNIILEQFVWCQQCDLGLKTSKKLLFLMLCLVLVFENLYEKIELHTAVT